jgi:uncharacterized protein YdeI (BOF family)
MAEAPIYHAIRNFERRDQMQEATILIAVLVLAFTGTAFAGFTGPGAMKPETVADAKKMRDDTHVTLEGYIVPAVEKSGSC